MKKDKVIVLQNIRHLESHLIVKGLNNQGQVLSFFASFALKSRKRFASGVLEPGGYIEVEYHPSKKEGGWNRLVQANILNKFSKIRKDYDRLDLALHCLKMFNKAGQEGIEGDPELFHLLGNTLTALETSSDLDSLKLFFEIRFLFLQGVLPTELQNKSVFFESTIKEHNQVDLSRENLPSIHQELKTALHQYLDI
ncbi:MAG: DNA repair protein RecO [Bdellovibrionales bacterium]|nr:DNA repair protein RecO [Bdellovibrionales bacterium]